MLFIVKGNNRLTIDHLRNKTLLNAYFIIQKYKLGPAELILDQYLIQHYKVSLKNMCIKLLLNLTFYAKDDGSLVLLFKDPSMDKIARLITYGNGVLKGSSILQIALNF
jgi:hypothetical protein